MIALMTLALQVTAPPLVLSAPAAPRATQGERKLDRLRVEVTVRSPETTLWHGELNLPDSGQATWQESVTEAGANCLGRFGDRSVQREASVQLYRQRTGQADDGATVMVTARWVRSNDAVGGCGATRTVELRQSVDLSTGPARLLGDGGLVIELRRR